MKTTLLFVCISLEEITFMEFYAFADLPNTFQHPPQILPRCHLAAGEHYESDCVATKGIILHMQCRDFVKVNVVL